jgi:hypothetical protein
MDLQTEHWKTEFVLQNQNGRVLTRYKLHIVFHDFIYENKNPNVFLFTIQGYAPAFY